MKRREFIKVATITTAVGGLNSPMMSGEWKRGPKAMPECSLGKTGVKVSILALGGVIGMQLPPSEKHDPVAIAETALDPGNWYVSDPIRVGPAGLGCCDWCRLH